MPTLASELRNKLERVVIEARDVAEAGAHAALEALAVHEAKHYPHMPKQQRELRNNLRARARQLGDRQDPTGRLAIAAAGMVKAADLLAGEYTLVITNVPYLTRNSQSALLNLHA